jgi:S1-C subfamily serine protease
MKNLIKVAFLSSIITAAMVYVILEWKPLRSEESRAPEVSLASSPVSLTTPAAPAPANLSDDERNNIDIYQKYSPGVVNITTITVAYDFFYRQVPQSGMGSGAVIDNQGHIVTNYHVVKDAEQLQVTLWDKSKHNAKMVGSDPNNDLAVIQIDAPRGLLPIPIGTSKGLLVGQKVLAIGNPFGLDRTLTTGIISSLGRSIESDNGRIIEDMIQTDAAINHGNSGGPLLNSQGQMIGINSAIISPNDSGSIGIGFAIPADTVRRITDELITRGYVRHAALGISTQSLVPLSDYPWLSDTLHLETNIGLMVVEVPRGSAAALGGIRGADNEIIVRRIRIPVGGDVILAIQGKEVDTVQQLQTEIDRYKPGDAVKITVLRNNKKNDLTVTLQEARRP